MLLITRLGCSTQLLRLRGRQRRLLAIPAIHRTEIQSHYIRVILSKPCRTRSLRPALNLSSAQRPPERATTEPRLSALRDICATTAARTPSKAKLNKFNPPWQMRAHLQACSITRLGALPCPSTNKAHALRRANRNKEGAVMLL